jgi:hypothetical protein
MGGHIIGQFIRQHPVVVSLVIVQGTLQDLVARHGELRTARDTDHLGHVGVVEELLPGLGVGFFGGFAGPGFAERADFVRTARGFLTA